MKSTGMLSKDCHSYLRIQHSCSSIKWQIIPKLWNFKPKKQISKGYMACPSRTFRCSWLLSRTAHQHLQVLWHKLHPLCPQVSTQLLKWLRQCQTQVTTMLSWPLWSPRSTTRRSINPVIWRYKAIKSSRCKIRSRLCKGNSIQHYA